MNSKKAKGKAVRGLGSGLSKLLGEDVKDTDKASLSDERVNILPIGRIYADPKQPRRDFSENDLEDLAASFRKTGVLQPILVMSGSDGSYRIVAGERRWRAAQRAGLHEIPVIVKSLSEEEILQVALIENIHRLDLNIVEEALSYQRLRDEFGYNQEEIGNFIGKSRSYVANILRLLNLPSRILGYLRKGSLSLGHVRGLVNHADAEALAVEMVERGLNVRQAESLVKSDKVNVNLISEKSISLDKISKDLESIFGVQVVLRSSGRGYIASIRFSDTGVLNDFVQVWQNRGGKF